VKVNNILPDLLLCVFLRIKLDKLLRVENGLIKQLFQKADEGLETRVLLDQLEIEAKEHVFEEGLCLCCVDL
jgi:hypothetical protein